MDSLSLQDLELRTRIGVTAEERSVEQRVTVSVEFFLDLRGAGQTDDLAKTIDYANVVEDLHTLAKTEHNTIEALAEDIAALLLKKYKAESLKVTVGKYPSLPGLKSASVSIVRPNK